ncbi:MAG: SCP2 sterol-binding domain-containing protein, partial [Clostridia bacterium]|nr:SCP2 sterol-binding domain-containing protein [Clostridia bacterium]
KYQIVLKKDGYEVLKDNFLQYTTKIETPFTVWNDISTGKTTGKEAMMKKQYKVKGDFNLMLHWEDYFGSTKGQKAKKTAKSASNEKPTNMLILLIPWIAFWIGPAIDAYMGSIISIAVCALTSLLFVKNKKTVYDVISSTAVIGFSVLILLMGYSNIIIPVSYLSFGLMWSLSCLTKVPLTAYYSMNNYNGESALENPLFMRTNKILTFLWGILYVLTSTWTFFLMQGDLSMYTSIINNIIPIAMMIFTKWFQNWYPAWYAKN